MKSILALSILSLALIQTPPCNAAVTFTDWTSVDTVGAVAVGAIGSVSVTFAGGSIDSGVTDGTSSAFNQPFFAPPLPNSDSVGFRAELPPFTRGGVPFYTYSVTFGAPVQNPVMDFASLASTLTFPGINLVKLSGESTFTVSGNSVSGVIFGRTDANGTIELPGIFTSFSFTALPLPGVSGGDGIATQIGGTLVPEPETYALMLAGLGLIGLTSRRKGRRHIP